MLSRRSLLVLSAFTATLLTASHAEATIPPCLVDGYRPAFGCTDCGSSTPQPRVAGRTVHLYGHDFDRYQEPVVVGLDAQGQEVIWASAVALNGQQVVFDAPPEMRSGIVWVEDAQPVHDVGPYCFDPESGQSWEGGLGDGCEPGVEMCRGEAQSVLRTVDAKFITLPVPTPSQLRIADKLSNAVNLDWDVDPRGAVDVQIEWRGTNSPLWGVMGRIGRTSGPEPITNLLPGGIYEFRVRAVAWTGEVSEASNTVRVVLPQVVVEYLDSHQVHPFYGDNSGVLRRANVTGVWVVHDTNSDALMPYRLGSSTDRVSPGALFPRFFDGQTCTVQLGDMYAPGANTIMLVEFQSSPAFPSHFAAVHLALRQQTWAGTMVTGSYGLGSQILMGTPAPEAIEAEMTYQTPTADSRYGRIDGWLRSEVFFNSCNSTFYGSMVRISFLGGLAIVPEADFR